MRVYLYFYNFSIISTFLKIHYFQLKDNCFTILYWFLLYSTWISHRYTYVPSLLNFSPTFYPILSLYIVTDYWFELLASYSKFPLASYFTYGSICFDTTPSISPTLSFSPLCSQIYSPCLRLQCCSVNRSISTIFLDSIYMS